MKTGWPASELMQDDCRKLSLWFASRLGARYQLQAMYFGVERLSRIQCGRCAETALQKGMSKRFVRGLTRWVCKRCARLHDIDKGRGSFDRPRSRVPGNRAPSCATSRGE